MAKRLTFPFGISRYYCEPDVKSSAIHSEMLNILEGYFTEADQLPEEHVIEKTFNRILELFREAVNAKSIFSQFFISTVTTVACTPLSDRDKLLERFFEAREPMMAKRIVGANETRPLFNNRMLDYMERVDEELREVKSSLQSEMIIDTTENLDMSP
jgi:hypothetical protein